MKIIYVETCAACPHRDYVNRCSLKLDLMRDIHTIPDWCPLEDEDG